MSTDVVRIEVDGTPLEARKGEMVIQATDRAGIYVPRFCYHEKLTVAANCRMCLVEQEKAPKPVPACATPVTEGMKVYTRSPRALAAQRATMEFLLINHPLDCPICDQGGECELQDLAMGFGRSISRFTEKKRAVADPNLGPLISTDMTRCIQCTRCVRFTDEIAGQQELGAFGRGEHMEIGTYIARSVDHEMSGNVIDLCPVGALNSKPFRFRARAWEMTQHPVVSPHDCVGSNMYAHILRGRLMRVVPRPNEAINETWLADRDRYSYEGVYAADRLAAPIVREGGSWRELGWEDALAQAADALRAAGPELATLASPSSTIEELYLLQKLVRGLGARDIDHRLRMQDFRDSQLDPLHPSLGLAIADIETRDAVLVIGSSLRREAPCAGAPPAQGGARRRPGLVRESGALRLPLSRRALPGGARGRDGGGARIPRARNIRARATRDPAVRARALRPRPSRRCGARDRRDAVHGRAECAAARSAGAAPSRIRRPARPRDRARRPHEQHAWRRQRRRERCRSLARGGRAASGARRSRARGTRPRHRADAGRAAQGLPAPQSRSRGGLRGRCLGRQLVRARGARGHAHLLCGRRRAHYARLMLPIGTFAETSGSYVNAEGRWQSFPGVATPFGSARPAWKVLRVLGNLLGLPGFEYASSEEVREELRALVGDATAVPVQAGSRVVDSNARGGAVVDLPMYAIDPVVRRAPALQATRDGRVAAARY
jgi:NADH-quinone oxidoreductase subunit G